jgi:hypothetical protein
LDFNNIRIYIYPEDKIPRDEWKMETIKLWIQWIMDKIKEIVKEHLDIKKLGL